MILTQDGCCGILHAHSRSVWTRTMPLPPAAVSEGELTLSVTPHLPASGDGFRRAVEFEPHPETPTRIVVSRIAGKGFRNIRDASSRRQTACHQIHIRAPLTGAISKRSRTHETECCIYLIQTRVGTYRRRCAPGSPGAEAEGRLMVQERRCRSAAPFRSRVRAHRRRSSSFV